MQRLPPSVHGYLTLVLIEMSDTPDRLGAIARWLQREDDELVYAPDGEQLSGSRTSSAPVALSSSWHITVHAGTALTPGQLVTWDAAALRAEAVDPLVALRRPGLVGVAAHAAQAGEPVRVIIQGLVQGIDWGE